MCFAGSGLCEELITGSEEAFRVFVCVLCVCVVCVCCVCVLCVCVVCVGLCGFLCMCVCVL
jgi:hypothetical protein